MFSVELLTFCREPGKTYLRLESIMEELDKRKNEALVAVALCTGTLITCFSIAFALI